MVWIVIGITAAVFFLAWATVSSQPPDPSASASGSPESPVVLENDKPSVGPRADAGQIPRREVIAPRPVHLQILDTRRIPVAGAVCWSAGNPGDADTRARLAVSDARGVVEFSVSEPDTPILVVAAGYLEQRLGVAPGADLRVVLEDSFDIELSCQDMVGRPLPGILVAVSAGPISDEWLHAAASAESEPRARTGDPYAVRSDAAGIARLVGLPRFDVRWRVHTQAHALVGGPGISDDAQVRLPGTYRLQFAPLIAAGFVVEGDRVAAVRKLDMPGGNLLPTDRGGAIPRARDALHARHARMDFVEVMAARDATALGQFTVSVMLAETGPRDIVVQWKLLHDFLAQGPAVVQVQAGAGPRAEAFVGRVVVRLFNPDGYEYRGRGVVLDCADGFFEAVTGTPKEAPVGKYRVRAREEAVNGYLPRPAQTVEITTGVTEVTLTMTQSLWPVRFRRPHATPGTPMLVVRNDQDGAVSAYFPHDKDHVDLLLPDKPLRAYANTLRGRGPEVRFRPRKVSDGVAPVEVELKR